MGVTALIFSFTLSFQHLPATLLVIPRLEFKKKKKKQYEFSTSLQGKEPPTSRWGTCLCIKELVGKDRPCREGRLSDPNVLATRKWRILYGQEVGHVVDDGYLVNRGREHQNKWLFDLITNTP